MEALEPVVSAYSLVYQITVHVPSMANYSACLYLCTVYAMLNPFLPNIMTPYGVMRILVHFWQCPLEKSSASAERVGQGEVGGCTCNAWACPGL